VHGPNFVNLSRNFALRLFGVFIARCYAPPSPIRPSEARWPAAHPQPQPYPITTSIRSSTASDWMHTKHQTRHNPPQLMLN
jgi:hypothetical protein